MYWGMNIDKIFNLFSKDEPDSLREKAQQIDITLDYKNHPLFWVGMFKKLVQNHQVFNDQLLKFFDKLDEGLNIKDVDKAGEYVVFNRYALTLPTSVTSISILHKYKKELFITASADIVDFILTRK